jgi:hypothetical protein
MVPDHQSGAYQGAVGRAKTLSSRRGWLAHTEEAAPASFGKTAARPFSRTREKGAEARIRAATPSSDYQPKSNSRSPVLIRHAPRDAFSRQDGRRRCPQAQTPRRERRLPIRARLLYETASPDAIGPSEDAVAAFATLPKDADAGRLATRALGASLALAGLLLLIVP